MVLRGPSIYTVPTAVGLALPVAAAVGSPSVSAAVTFQFPRDVFVHALFALPRPLGAFATLQAQIAQLSLSVVDEKARPLVTDTRGTLRGTSNAPAAAPFLALFGRAFRPYELQRPMRGGDQWVFTFQNEDTVNAQVLGGLYLYISEPSR